MKKFLKFSGFVAAVLGIVAFILVMAAPALIVKNSLGTASFDGIVAIFGKKEGLTAADALYLTNSDGVIVLAPLALIGWILLLSALLIVLIGIILPLLKVHALDKIAGVLNLIAVGAFIVAGIFFFTVVGNLFAANGRDIANGAAIGAGWVIAGILAILAGVCAILPAAVDFIGKKK